MLVFGGLWAFLALADRRKFAWRERQRNFDFDNPILSYSCRTALVFTVMVCWYGLIALGRFLEHSATGAPVQMDYRGWAFQVVVFTILFPIVSHVLQFQNLVRPRIGLIGRRRSFQTPIVKSSARIEQNHRT